MELKLTYYGNPILRRKCDAVQKITKEIKELALAMIEKMKVANGIGLAAPQVNHPLRLFVTCVPIQQDDESWEPGTPRIFINPRIVSTSDEIISQSEGCLSIPDVYGEVERPFEVTVEATDLEGNTFCETFSDLEARCILHENDHINGKLFVDRMDKRDRKKLDPLLREVKKKYHD